MTFEEYWLAQNIQAPNMPGIFLTVLREIAEKSWNASEDSIRCKLAIEGSFKGK